jgi:hypothetical protein
MPYILVGLLKFIIKSHPKINEENSYDKGHFYKLPINNSSKPKFIRAA